MSGPFRPIQALLRGFFSLQGLKNMGQYPDTLLGEVQPGVDMEDWWLRGSAAMDPNAYTVNLASFGAAVTSFTTPCKVPADKVWWVESAFLDVFVPGAAGEYIENVGLVIAYEASPALKYGYVAPTITLTGAAANSTHGEVGARGFWLPGGAELMVYSGRTATASAIVASLWLRRTELQS